MKSKHLLVFLVALTCFVRVNGQENNKPNVLFIAIDDLKPTLASYGDTFAITPNMDKIASKGTVFLNNHTQQAVCGPARASLMTGKRPDYTKVRDLKTKMRDMNPTILTIPQYFKQNGYTTAGTGKIYDPRCVDKFLDQPSWSIPFKNTHNLTFAKGYNKPIKAHYQSEKIKSLYIDLQKEAKLKDVKNVNKYVASRLKPPYESANVPDDAYTDGAIANHAIGLLDQLGKNQDTPFFLAVGFKKPHLPFVAPTKYWDLYNADDIQLAPFQKKSKNGTDIAYHSSGELRSYKSPEITYTVTDEKLLSVEEAVQRKLIHGYYACTSYVDAQIGKIMSKLKENNLDKNTIIVIWGDHGWHLGDHSLWNKHSAFEQATRSPLIVYSPFVEKEVKVTSPTEFLDIFPTLCDLTGLEIPANLDGVSLKPLVNAEVSKVKEVAVSQQPRGKNIGYTFRSEKYRYTVWVAKKKSTDGITKKDEIAHELYDYVNDPLETTNHYGTKKYAKIQVELEKQAKLFFKKQAIKKVSSCTPNTKLNKEVKIKKSIKKIMEAKFDANNVFVGATLNYSQLGTKVEKLFLKDFSYSTPENCAKQSRVHPRPNTWKWDQIDAYVAFATKNNVTIRLHGPVSPQASKWAKHDARTGKELDKNMEEYFTALCKRFNNNTTVKWMDVVNETIEPDGTWFKDKPGVDLWENPWVKMGYNADGIPKYITKAFSIANKYAPNKSLVYNQHGGMQPEMWEKVKETIVALRAQGYRIDGLGWQAHLRSDVPLAMDQKSLDYFGELIDWAHTNKLDFHVTEIDYKIWDGKKTNAATKLQAKAYANILEVLVSKRKTGVVTYNTWGMVDGTGNHADKYMFIYDENKKPKPAYFAIKNILNNAE